MLLDNPISLAKLRTSIKTNEGTGPIKNDRFMPYRDSVGKLTIGYGRNLDDNGIRASEANFLLDRDIDYALLEAQQQVWWPWVEDDDVRGRVFVEMGFALGFNSLLGFHVALGAAERKDWAACSAAFLDSLWHSQVGKRAETLAAMILTGKDQPTA